MIYIYILIYTHRHTYLHSVKLLKIVPQNIYLFPKRKKHSSPFATFFTGAKTPFVLWSVYDTDVFDTPTNLHRRLQGLEGIETSRGLAFGEGFSVEIFLSQWGRWFGFFPTTPRKMGPKGRGRAGGFLELVVGMVVGGSAMVGGLVFSKNISPENPRWQILSPIEFKETRPAYKIVPCAPDLKIGFLGLVVWF